jgi:hypothetical protein
MGLTDKRLIEMREDVIARNWLNTHVLPEYDRDTLFIYREIFPFGEEEDE